MASTHRGTSERKGGAAALPVIALASGMALVLALGGPAIGPARVPPAIAEPRVIGRTETAVPILRGRGERADSASAASAASAAGATVAAGANPEALALARRFVTAFGGPVALRAWLDRGERHGRQSLYLPAQMSLRYVERRQDGRARVDAQNGGVDVSFAEGPADNWQSYLGLVSDLPVAQKDEIDRARAHDESLLLDVLDGRASARAVRVDGADALRVDGPLGGPTTFVAGPAGPDGGPAEIRFRDRSELRPDDVDQALTYSDWRALAPERPGLVGPEGARVPFVLTHAIDGAVVEADSLDTVDLLAAIDDSVFARPGDVNVTVGPARRTVLPLTARDGHHFAPVSINGGAPRLFLVDTGAGVTAISRQLADTLGLGLGGEVGIVGLSRGVPARSATLHALGLGDFTRADVPCFVLDLGDLRTTLGIPVEGILGFSALNRYAVTFDFARGALELAENAPVHVPGAGGARLPLDLLGGVVTVDGRVEAGDPIPFLLDTGSPRSFVPTRVGRTLAGATARRPSRAAFTGADGRTLWATEVRAKSLALGAARMTSLPLLFLPEDHGQDPIGLTLGSGDRGVLGADVLTRFRVTLDYPRREVVLDRR